MEETGKTRGRDIGKSKELKKNREKKNTKEKKEIRERERKSETERSRKGAKKNPALVETSRLNVRGRNQERQQQKRDSEKERRIGWSHKSTRPDKMGTLRCLCKTNGMKEKGVGEKTRPRTGGLIIGL